MGHFLVDECLEKLLAMEIFVQVKPKKLDAIKHLISWAFACLMVSVSVKKFPVGNWRISPNLPSFK